MADQGSRHSRAVIASRSCDACRARKVRCDSRLSPSPFVASEAQQSTSCRRCTRLSLPCTFETVRQPRGPKRKRPQEVASTTPEDANELESVNGTSNASQGAISPAIFPQLPQARTANSSLAYPTDALCSRDLLLDILQDYLTYLYPLIPVVHRPSFRRDLLQDRDVRDDVFFGFILALCAAVIGVMPSKFDKYRSLHPSLTYHSRVEMINRCYDMVMALRGPTYFDEINYQKFAIAYLLYITFFQLGEQNRSRMLECEGMQLGRLLNLHKSSEDDGLNCIEMQLRKKGFWLLFYGYVHSQLQNLRREKLTFLDPVLLASIDLKKLVPADVDDELILENVILPSEPGIVSLSTGFNIHSSVFRAALVQTPFAPVTNSATTDTCQCRRAKDRTANVTYLNERLHELKYMLDVVPGPLRQWAQASSATIVPENEAALPTDLSGNVMQLQFSSMRANLHVTHLWLQSMLIDQLDAAETAIDPNRSTRKVLWAQREECCRQLLHILHSLPEAALEPNGLHLTFKVRDVAVGMLACPHDEDDRASKRAAEYVLELTAILSRLDRSERINTANSQSWVDTDRFKEIHISDMSQYGDW